MKCLCGSCQGQCLGLWISSSASHLVITASPELQRANYTIYTPDLTEIVASFSRLGVI